MGSKWLVFPILILVSGCGKPSVVASAIKDKPKPAAPADPAQALFEQVRAGNYQISSAIDEIEDVRKTSKSLASQWSGNTKQALLTISSQLDEAGKALSDVGDEPDRIEDFRSNFAAEDEKRLKAIDACNESLDDLRDAQDLLGDLLDSKPPPAVDEQLSQADSDLEACVQALEDAIKALGGKITSS